jgi:Luciferase
MGKDVTDIFIEKIMWFPGVQETRGEMFGERSFRIDGREFLHVHGRSTLHLLLSMEAKSEAIARGLAHQHPYAPRSGMVELRLRREDQLGAALGLAKQSYDYMRSRIQKAAAQAAQL